MNREDTEVVEAETAEVTDDDTSSVDSVDSCLRSASVGAEPRSPGPCAPSRGSSDVMAEETVPSDTPTPFTFVDVFGEEYETTLNPAVEKNPYDPAAYTTGDGRIRYEDDTYISDFGIDVSHHQGRIDWERAAADGVTFAFLRIGYRGYGQEGNLRPDTEFERNIAGAQAAGIDVGVYLFSQAINEEEAAEEARFVIERLQGHSLQLPVIYDPEHILDAPARTDDVPGEQVTKNTIVFCRMIEEAGYEAGIYSNMLFEAFEFDLAQLSDYPLWYADYEPLPQTPYHFVYWQYSNEGRVSGVDGVVDLNIRMRKK